MVIDAHVHLYPESVNENPAAYADARKEPHWKLLSTRTRKNGKPVQQFPCLDQLLRTLDEAKIDRAILQGWYWETPETCAEQNRFYADCIKKHPDRLSAFAAINTNTTQNALTDEIRRARDHGLAGLGELSPHSQQIAVDSDNFQHALALAQHYRLPVNFHVTDDKLPSYPGQIKTPLADFLRIAEKYPNLPIILSHWAAKIWQTADDKLPSNILLDTAASPILYDDGVHAEALAKIPAEKILFGSDHPLDLYPRQAAVENQLVKFLAETRDKLPPETREKILGQNAAALIGIS